MHQNTNPQVTCLGIDYDVVRGNLNWKNLRTKCIAFDFTQIQSLIKSNSLEVLQHGWSTIQIVSGQYNTEANVEVI